MKLVKEVNFQFLGEIMSIIKPNKYRFVDMQAKFKEV